MRRALLVAGLALALGVPLALVVQKERVLRSGRTVLLALGTRDPRSLMQGDYMELRYRIAGEAWGRAHEVGADGRLVLADDERGVARLVRVSEGEPLAPGEYLLRYRLRARNVRLGAESFLFQEGTGNALAAARFGELRVDADGDAVLIGLRDDDLRPLGRLR